MDRAVLLSDGEAAALSIEEAAEESESFMHGNLSHVTALGQVHHIQDHAPQSAAFVRQKALAVAAITGVLLAPPTADIPPSHCAVLAGQTGATRTLLDCKADPRAFLPAGHHPHCTALHLAALHGHWGCCTELLHYSARLDSPLDKLSGAPPIEWARHATDPSIVAKCELARVFYQAVDAILAGDVEQLRALLTANRGLASSRVVGQPRYLLHYAMDWPGHRPNIAAAVGLLVEHGADVNAVMEPEFSLREGEDGPGRESALHWAASNDDVPALQALLSHGASQRQCGGLIGNGPALWDAAVFGPAQRCVKGGAKFRAARPRFTQMVQHNDRCIGRLIAALTDSLRGRL